ncbi:MAG: lysophospholipid acyltransferase family protein [Anaerolineaceae bacterium]|nr:MAG: lysophospholipid acyltransferase family protein [Anaerolineaceae bacterium]
MKLLSLEERQQIAYAETPRIGASVPRRGNWATRLVASSIMRLLGWRIVGEVPDLPKILMIGAPHTSAWDFLLTVLTVGSLGGDLHYLVKQSFFASPLGGLIRWLGGIPVDRQNTRGFVDQMIDEFERRDTFMLAIMPEGTRSKVKEWRSGFYYIALGAGVPISLVIFDFGEKLMRLGPALTPSGDYETELPVLQSYFLGIRGKNPT